MVASNRCNCLKSKTRCLVNPIVMDSIQLNASVVPAINDTSESHNTTFDPYHEAYENIYVRLYFGITVVVLELAGNYLLAVLIVSINEDPLVMLTDRLLSILCSLVIVINLHLSVVGKHIWCVLEMGLL